MAMDLNDLLVNSVNNYPAKVALKYEERVYTYEQFHKRVCKLANALLNSGVGLHDKVAVIAQNCSEYIEILFACAKIGAVSEHFNWRLAPVIIRASLEDSSAGIVFMTRNNSEIYGYLKANLSRPVTFILIGHENTRGIGYEEFIKDGNDFCASAGLQEDDAALQLYTSGTTGKPKGVLFTTESIVTQTLVTVIEKRFKHDDVLLFQQALFHIPLISVFDIFTVGGTLILSKSCNAAELVRFFREERVTRAGFVPYTLNILAAYLEKNDIRITSLRTIDYGTAPMNAELLEKCIGLLRCEFQQSYGMTEMAGTVTMLRPEHHAAKDKLVTVGKPQLGVQIKIVKENGEDCKAGETGEIAARSKAMMKCYFNNPELTAEAIRDGWYHTGDIGFIDEDGFLHLLDRKKNMIICGGENIYPKEVADCIRSMGTDILDAEVIGIPDGLWGQQVMAAIVKKAGSQLTAQDIIDHCKSNLASYKKPKYVYFLRELPRNAALKVDREKLKELHFRSIKS